MNGAAPRRHGSRVLHEGPEGGSAPGWPHLPSARVAPVRGARGASLLEALISLTIMAIGILAVLSLLVTARRDAEVAADRAAFALAARQMLENRIAGWAPVLPVDRVVPVGVHRVRVTLEAETASAGLLRLRSRTRDPGGDDRWILETLEAGP